MLRKYFLLPFCLVISCICSAQSGKISFGVQAGGGIVSMRGNEILDQYLKSDLRIPFGLILELKLKNDFYLAANVNAEQKGARTGKMEIYDNLGNSMGMGTLNNRLGYITVPVMIGKNFGSKMIFKAQLGGFFGILTSARTIAEIDGGATSETNENAYFESIDLGITGGLGISIPINAHWRAGFQLNNNLGLKNISRTHVVGGGSVKTNSLNGMLNLVYTK